MFLDILNILLMSLGWFHKIWSKANSLHLLIFLNFKFLYLFYNIGLWVPLRLSSFRPRTHQVQFFLLFYVLFLLCGTYFVLNPTYAFQFNFLLFFLLFICLEQSFWILNRLICLHLEDTARGSLFVHFFFLTIYSCFMSVRTFSSYNLRFQKFLPLSHSNTFLRYISFECLVFPLFVQGESFHMFGDFSLFSLFILVGLLVAQISSSRDSVNHHTIPTPSPAVQVRKEKKNLGLLNFLQCFRRQ